MSVRGLYQLTDGTFVRTQGEIPKGEPVNKVEVPVDSKGLCAYLNDLLGSAPEQNFDAGADTIPSPVVEAPPVVSRSLPPAAPTEDHAAFRRKMTQELRGMETEAMEERMLEAKGTDFARLFVAGVERFGVLGKDAWKSVHGFLDLHASQIGPYDRGLHLLALMQIEANNEPARAPQTYKELNK